MGANNSSNNSQRKHIDRYLGIFFLIIAILIIFFLTHSANAPSEGGEDVGLVVEELDNGQLVVKDEANGVELVVPEGFEQPSQDTLSFFDEERSCKLTVNKISHEVSLTLEDLINSDKEDLEFMTVLERDVDYLNESKTKAIYKLDTVETGLSEVYYEDLGDYYLQVTAFSSEKLTKCYKEVENL